MQSDKKYCSLKIKNGEHRYVDNCIPLVHNGCLRQGRNQSIQVNRLGPTGHVPEWKHPDITMEITLQILHSHMQMHWMRLIGRSPHPRMTHPSTGNRQNSMGTHLLARAYTFRRKPEVELVIRETYKCVIIVYNCCTYCYWRNIDLPRKFTVNRIFRSCFSDIWWEN